MMVQLLRRVMVALALGALLQGCYLKSDTKLLEKGVKVPLAAKYSCQNKTGDPEPFLTREENSGWWFFNANYTYYNAASTDERFLAMHIKDDFYLIQMKEVPPFDYYYLSVMPNKVLVYSVSESPHGAFNSALNKYALSFDAGTYKISGDKAKMLEFMKNFPREALSVVRTCEVTKS